MRRPSIPYKPDAPSVHPLVGKLTLPDKLRALDRLETTSEAQLVAELEGPAPSGRLLRRRPASAIVLLSAATSRRFLRLPLRAHEGSSQRCRYPFIATH
jgi:hypothetical protein